MDNLQHIDDLLKKVSQVPANALVTESDWNAIDKRLKRRKSRIYALWLFLALLSVSTVSILLLNKDCTTAKPVVIQENNTSDPQPSTGTVYHDPEQVPDIKTVPTNSDLIVSFDKPNKTVKNKDLALSQPTLVDGSYKPNINTPTLSDNIKEFDKQPQYQVIDELAFPHNLTLKNISDIPYTIPTNWNIPPLPTTSLTGIHIKNPVFKCLNTGTSGWEVGVSFTPSISNKFVTENSALSGLIHREYYDKVANSESASFGNTFGFNGQYHFKNGLYLSSGIFSTRRSESVDYKYSITDFRENTDGVVGDYVPHQPPGIVDIDLSRSNSYHFIEIPINIGYKRPLLGNFELRTQVGASYLGLLNADGQIGDFFSLELKNLKDLNLRKYNIGANVKSGVYYNFPRLVVGVEPTFSTNLNSLSDNSTSAIKTRPYGYGLNITTNIKLGKK